MKSRVVLFALALAFAAPAFARDYIQLADIAAETGLTARQVAMVLGAHSAYPEYLSSYDRVERQFLRAVGRERFNELQTAYRQGKIRGVYAQVNGAPAGDS